MRMPRRRRPQRPRPRRGRTQAASRNPELSPARKRTRSDPLRRRRSPRRAVVSTRTTRKTRPSPRKKPLRRRSRSNQENNPSLHGQNRNVLRSSRSSQLPLRLSLRAHRPRARLRPLPTPQGAHPRRAGRRAISMGPVLRHSKGLALKHSKAPVLKDAKAVVAPGTSRAVVRVVNQAVLPARLREARQGLNLVRLREARQGLSLARLKEARPGLSLVRLREARLARLKEVRLGGGPGWGRIRQIGLLRGGRPRTGRGIQPVRTPEGRRRIVRSVRHRRHREGRPPGLTVRRRGNPPGRVSLLRLDRREGLVILVPPAGRQPPVIMDRRVLKVARLRRPAKAVRSMGRELL